MVLKLLLLSNVYLPYSLFLWTLISEHPCKHVSYQWKAYNESRVIRYHSVDGRIWTRATLVEVECSYHCLTLAHNYFISIQLMKHLLQSLIGCYINLAPDEDRKAVQLAYPARSPHFKTGVDNSSKRQPPRACMACRLKKWSCMRIETHHHFQYTL